MTSGPAIRLYSGDVMHARLKPFSHRFRYRVFNMLIDIDRMAEADRQTPLFSVGKWNVLSFHPDDFGRAKNAQRPEGESLRAYINRLLDEAGLDAKDLRLELMCYPRIFGYAFNPISVYFAWDNHETLRAVIYEVRNTFGEMHSYVAPVEPGELTDAGLRQERDKRFHVSPFMPMDQRYHFRISPPADNVRLRILESDAGGPILSATFAGDVQPFDTRHILLNLLSMGFFSFKIMAGIHWEALKLWLKGAKFHKSPPAPEAVSFSEDKPLTAVPHGQNAAR
jgi:hypothetical protein